MYQYIVYPHSLADIFFPFASSPFSNTNSPPFQFGNLLGELTDIVQKDIRYFDIRGVSTIVHALAKLGERGAAIFSEVEKHASWIVENGEPQAVSNTAWACAKLNVQSPSLFHSIDENAVRLVKSAKSQEVASVAWACATLNVQSPSLFQSIDENAARLVENGGPQEIANTAWACATLKVQSPALFRSIEKNSARLVKDGTPQAVANTAWACATLKVRSPSFFRSVKEIAARLVKYGSPQAIANTAWSFAALNIRAFPLCRPIEERATWLVQNGNPQDIASIAWSFARLTVHAPSLFRSIDERSAWLVKNGSPRAIANTCLAFAEVGIRPEQLFRCLGERGRLEQFLKGANSQDVCNTAWSVVVLGLESERDTSLLLALWGAALRDHAGETTTEELCQIAQVQMHARASGVTLSPTLPPALKARMIKAARSRGTTDSTFESEYSQLLSEIGFEHEREVSPFTGDSSSSGADGEDFGEFLAIDMACRKRKVAVEVDGKYHFLTELKVGARANSGKENGTTVAKRRLLRQLGWKVVNVPFYDSNRLESNEDLAENEEGGTRELKRKRLEPTQKPAARGNPNNRLESNEDLAENEEGGTRELERKRLEPTQKPADLWELKKQYLREKLAKVGRGS